MRWLLNAFSLNMLPPSSEVVTRVRRLNLQEAQCLARTAQSAVGHLDTANLMGRELGFPIAFDRKTIALEEGDECLVGQYVGPRLPEGAMQLPPGGEMVWFLIRLEPPREPSSEEEGRSDP
jgi:hypothetical protein